MVKIFVILLAQKQASVERQNGLQTVSLTIKNAPEPAVLLGFLLELWTSPGIPIGSEFRYPGKSTNVISTLL